MDPTRLALSRVGLLVNPASGDGRAQRLGARLRDVLLHSGHEVVDLAASDGASARQISRAAVHDGRIDALAVVGGDGTVHIGANACAGTGVPLAILAAGTGNDNARALGLGAGDVALTARLLGAARVKPVDLGRSRGINGRADRWWLGVLGGGFDTVVNQRARRIRWVHGTARYVAAVAAELRTFRGFRYAVHVDGERIKTTAMLVAVGNGVAFGGGMRVCPDARMDDGLLDVTIVHQVSRREFVRVFPKVFRGAHVDHPAVHMLRGRTVRLAATGVRTQADGEDFLALPVTLEAAPAALRVCAP